MSDPFINCLYQIVFPVVVSSTTFILKGGLINGSEARLISCWTMCCNFSGKFIVVKSASVLSIEEVLGQGLDLNLVDGERKCDVFGEVLDLEARRSLQ